MNNTATYFENLVWFSLHCFYCLHDWKFWVTLGVWERLFNMLYLQLPLFNDLKWPALGKWAWMWWSRKEKLEREPTRNIYCVTHTDAELKKEWGEVWNMTQSRVEHPSFCKHWFRSFWPNLLLRIGLYSPKNKTTKMSKWLELYFGQILHCSLFYVVFEHSSNQLQK